MVEYKWNEGKGNTKERDLGGKRVSKTKKGRVAKDNPEFTCKSLVETYNSISFIYFYIR